MLSSVLRSPRAIEVNIEIMRAFVRIRQLLSVHTDLAERLEKLERQMRSETRPSTSNFATCSPCWSNSLRRPRRLAGRSVFTRRARARGGARLIK